MRIGNAAWNQFQLDVFGEVCDTMFTARRLGLSHDEHVWRMLSHLAEYLETHWRDPDEGIWEVRGPRRHFVHSKVMAWVAFDRMVKSVERFQVDGPIEKWSGIRDEIHREVCQHGYDSKRNTFVQSYGSDELDASLLMIPLVGFLPPNDRRVQGTIAAIQRELTQDGFVARYRLSSTLGELPPGQGVFLPCSFWMVDNLLAIGRRQEAEEMFRAAHLAGKRRRLYSPKSTILKPARMLGNFPQAFTHIAFVNSAFNLWHSSSPAEHRQKA